MGKGRDGGTGTGTLVEIGGQVLQGVIGGKVHFMGEIENRSTVGK